jgi:uncharacterized protein (DUF169 family)
MSDFKNISHDLIKNLELKYEAVGVTLFQKGDALPEGISFAAGNFKSYCQALVLAGEGQTLLLKKEQMGCKLGTAVLGFEKGRELEAYVDDGIMEKYGVGLFASEEAAAATILKAPYLKRGKTQAVLIAPLSAFAGQPQVVVFTADSEQVMWLLYAANYETGGPMALPQSGGALGGCADITALPLLKGVSNITFLGLGCRIKTGLDPCHLMMGLPGQVLASVHTHILDMAKPITMLTKARAGGAK